jgi:hypothetical protein
MPSEQQVLDHGRAFEQLDVLECARDAVPGGVMARNARDVLPAQRDAAAFRAEDARDHVEHRGLAGAVRADDGKHLALLDRKAHVADGVEPAETQRNVLHRKIAHR